MRAARSAHLWCTALICAACTAQSDVADPGSTLERILAVSDAGDRAALADLVEALDNDDAAVRLAAISTLRHLTGRTLGYRAYDPAPVRDAAVRRWVALVAGDRPPGRQDEPDDG